MKLVLSVMLALSLLWSPLAWAVSNQYILPGTPITFGDTGSNYGIDFSATASGAGKYSDRADLGAGAHAAQFAWSCQFSLTGTNVPGSYIEIYISWSDGTNADGALGTTKSTLTSADKRRNLKRIGTLVIDQATTNVVMNASGQAFVPTRYFTLAYWNATGLPFQTSTTLHRCQFTPIPWQMQ